MLSLKLYEKLYLVRRAELAIIENYKFDEMKTPMHMSMGAEHIAVGVCEALGDKGQFFCSYRSHAVYLARAHETDEFFAELYGKESKIARGKSGSMHLSSVERGFFGASAIVASPLPVAVGAAYANQFSNSQKITAVFFGDGAIDEGNFWESLNLACQMKLPLLFVCEDNDLAVHTPRSQRHGYSSITSIVSKFNCSTFEESSTDVDSIHALTQKAITAIHEFKRPAFLHLNYYRYLEHVGVNEDFNAGYRDKALYEEWRKKDPIDLQRLKLVQNGFPKEELVKLEKGIDNQVEASLARARKLPFPSKEALYKDVLS